MNFKVLFVLLLAGYLFKTIKLAAQTENDQLIEQIIESVAENADENFDYSELVERLNFYRKNPIHINKAAGEQLKELVFLSPVLINNLLQHIANNGELADTLELQSVTGFDTETIKKLIPFISIRHENDFSTISAKNLLAKSNHDLIMRYGQVVEKQTGFLIPDTANKSRYLGSPQRLLFRYRYTYSTRLSASLTMEKDAGEAFFSGAQSAGFDFYSGNLYLKNTGILSKLIIGDYALQFGQGLTLWCGLGFGKGAAISTVPRQNIGLRPYSSTNEVLFFRGIAATVTYKKLSFTPFASSRKLDAGFAEQTVADSGQVTSLNQTGFHRTANEIKNKNSLSQLVYGLNLQYTSGRLNTGAVICQTHFDNAFESSGQQYTKHEFTGTSLTNTGIYYDYNWRNLYFFGEASHSLNSGFAYLNGLIASLSPRVSAVIFQRNYQRNYQSFFSQAISESSKAVNEKGLYTGLTINPSPKIEISSYADFFRFPWLKYRVDAPSRGYEVFTQFTYTLKNKIKIGLRYKFKYKQENDDTENTIDFLQGVERSTYRAEVNYNINSSILLRSRLEMVKYQKEDHRKETGYLLFQDVIYNPITSKFSGSMRFAIFDTPSYNSRVYAYESDVLYSYSVPAYQNRGVRCYITGRYTISRVTDIWVRYAITNYVNVNEIGSGLDLIQGNKKSDLKLQLRFRF